jgi:hypothetical protein
MPRGGKRQGTPGTGYANRVDLQANMAPDTTGSAARGGMEMSGPIGQPTRSPDDSPMLLTPTMRPDEPVSAGLPSGPGGGPEMLGMDPREEEARRMREKWLPYLKPVVEEPDTPDSVKMLYRFLRGA